MSSILTAIYDKFGVSEPVFNLSVDSDADTIQFIVRKPYLPECANPQDPVEQMLVKNYRESFNRRTTQFEKDDIRRTCWCSMASTLIKFFLYNSPLKSPKQSKTYRFLKRLEARPGSTPFADGVVSLYRYLDQHRGVLMTRHSKNSDNVHAKNILLILEKMKEKYEQTNGT